MTRGTFILITKKKVYESIEFNGDMYPEGYGDTAFDMLKNQVTNVKTFKEMVSDFNQIHHGYEEKKKVWDKDWFVNDTLIKREDGTEYEQQQGMFEKDGSINFSNDYYSVGRFFSDWLFIKNLSGKDIEYIENNNERVTGIIPNGNTERFNFGKYYNESIKKYQVELIETLNYATIEIYAENEDEVHSEIEGMWSDGELAHTNSGLETIITEVK